MTDRRAENEQEIRKKLDFDQDAFGFVTTDKPKFKSGNGNI